MKPESYSQITNYFALASSILGTSTASSNIIYTDIEPDVYVSNNFFDINLDNQGPSEFRLEQDGPNNRWAFIKKLNSNAQVIGTLQPNPVYAEASILSSSYFIGSTGNWLTSSITSVTLGWQSFTSYGQFQGQENGLVGVSFEINGNTHYGWLRVELAANSGFIRLQDYAYNSIPNSPIKAGELIFADTVTNIQIIDTSDNIDATDIFVNFSKAIDESTVSKYKVFYLSMNDVGSFTKNDAEALDTNRSITILKNGSDQNIRFSSNIKDVNGNGPTQGENYQIGVLSVTDSTNSFISTLTFSKTFKLNFDTLRTDVVQDIQIEDVANKGDASDLRLIFNYNSDLSYVKEFRLFAVKAEDSNNFSIAKANETNLYLTLYPILSTISQTLPSFMRDIDGDNLIASKDYCFFIKTVSKKNPPFAADTLKLEATCGMFDSPNFVNYEISESPYSISNSVLKFNYGVEEVTVFTVQGTNINPSISQCDVKSIMLKRGIYILRYTFKNQLHTHKIIIP